MFVPWFLSKMAVGINDSQVLSSKNLVPYIKLFLSSSVTLSLENDLGVLSRYGKHVWMVRTAECPSTPVIPFLSIDTPNV